MSTDSISNKLEGVSILIVLVSICLSSLMLMLLLLLLLFLSEFENSNELYKQMRVIYEAEFNYDQVLQVATSLPDYPIKLWSLILEGSHSIVHVSMSGVNIMYHFFKKSAWKRSNSSWKVDPWWRIYSTDWLWLALFSKEIFGMPCLTWKISGNNLFRSKCNS